MSNPSTTDVCVIGAGIIGASCAFRLASRGLNVKVLEALNAPAMGSTGKSAAGVRVQFTTAGNIGLSMASLPVYRSFPEEYGHEIGYQDIGYLLLVDHGRWEKHLEAVELQRSFGAPVEVLTPEDAQRFVDFDTEGLAGATYGPWDGVIDPHMTTHAFVALARDRGAEFRMDSRVTGIQKAGDVWRVESSTGVVEAAHVVNAAGAWSGEIGRMAGLDVPVRPKRIQIFLSAPITDTRTYPLTLDLPTGVYVRSEGNRVLFGLDDLEQGFGFTEGMEWDWLEHVLLTGVDRFPWWEDLGVDRKGSWWGYYEVTPDHSPVIGPNPGADGWIDACGFSGHGIMHAPATGIAVADLVTEGQSQSVDIGPFAHARFVDGRPTTAVESNVF